MPTDFRRMDPSSGLVLAQLLRDLSTKLTQGASSISHAPTLSKMKALENDVRVTLAVLRRHINPLVSPLYRLPPDLFPEIASHFADETNLVNTTHVSFHFRNTLCSHPSLWSHPNFKCEGRARAFFERSGQVPLHIDMARDARRTVASLTELRQQSNRIVTLKLGDWPVQNAFLSEPLPSLRRLEISTPPYYHGDWREERDTVWTPVWGSKQKATSWSFPSLTSLIVHNLNPIPFYTPHVTRLKFHDLARPMDTDQLLNFLDNCSLLEDIDILDGWTHGRRNLVVSLPNLRNFTQTTFEDSCRLTVLNVLSISPSCSVTLRFQNAGGTTSNILPPFENRDYLAEIKRVKLRTTYDDNGAEVAGTLELINTGGTMVRTERMDPEEKLYRPPVRGKKKYLHNKAHLTFLKSLDCRSVEMLCIDGCAWLDEVEVEFLKEALGSGNVRTLILTRSAVWPCLSALGDGRGSSMADCRLFLSINTIIIGADEPHLYEQYVDSLLSLARKKEVEGFPFRSVSLFFLVAPGWRCNQIIENLRVCVEELEVVVGDGALDLDVDKYFLDGLGHLQMNRDIEWD